MSRNGLARLIGTAGRAGAQKAPHRARARRGGDFGFDNFNPRMGDATVRFLEDRGRERNGCFRLLWKHFGLAGGSYFRTEAILDAFDPVHTKRIDWKGMYLEGGEEL
ncbi:unnamed protein product [Prorocentrum cordatum]|uniref:Uncharacterized protein n=1 Tax=Prorocentrum cordatum TaxID=2364126 RepID=A0ABN9R4F2_9DINO|nr:unnamed protein product [Polarella glacialis]